MRKSGQSINSLIASLPKSRVEKTGYAYGLMQSDKNWHRNAFKRYILTLEFGSFLESLIEVLGCKYK